MRLLPLDPDNLTESQKNVRDAIEQGPRGRGRPGIGLIGPFGVWVRAPSVGNAIQSLGVAIRYSSDLPENIKEVAICTVGAYYRAKFEFSAHHRLALQAGVAAAALDAIRDSKVPDLPAAEAVAYAVANELLLKHRVSDQTYALATATFGETGIIELVATIGYYCLISITLNAFEIPLEPGMDDPFPGEP